MLYLLDANVLITANNTYYPVDRVAEYWEWLIYMSKSGYVKMPLEIFEEVKDGPKDAERIRICCSVGYSRKTANQS